MANKHDDDSKHVTHKTAAEAQREYDASATKKTAAEAQHEHDHGHGGTHATADKAGEISSWVKLPCAKPRGAKGPAGRGDQAR